MGKLFIRHSSKDKFIAEALAGRAKALGYDCFLDFQGNLRCPRQSVAVLVCAIPAV
jgi:hypothetical protein